MTSSAFRGGSESDSQRSSSLAIWLAVFGGGFGGYFETAFRRALEEEEVEDSETVVCLILPPRVAAVVLDDEGCDERSKAALEGGTY